MMHHTTAWVRQQAKWAASVAQDYSPVGWRAGGIILWQPAHGATAAWAGLGAVLYTAAEPQQPRQP